MDSLQRKIFVHKQGCLNMCFRLFSFEEECIRTELTFWLHQFINCQQLLGCKHLSKGENSPKYQPEHLQKSFLLVDAKRKCGLSEVEFKLPIGTKNQAFLN